MDTRGDDDARGRGAALAGGEECRLRHGLDGDLEVGVIEHDGGVLAAHFELELAANLDRGQSNALAGADRAGEGDGVDVLGFQHGLADHRALAHHQVQHALGQAGADQDIDDSPGRARNQVGRLDHHGIAKGQRRGDLPGRDGDGEVPRRDDADDANRLAGDFDADAGAHRRDDLARQAQHFTGKEIKNLCGAGHFANAFRQGLAFFAAQQLAQFGLARQDFLGSLAQDGMALKDARTRPGGESRLGGCDGLLGLFGRSLRVNAHHIIDVGGVDVLAPLRADPFASDEVLMQCHGMCLLRGSQRRSAAARSRSRWLVP